MDKYSKEMHLYINAHDLYSVIRFLGPDKVSTSKDVIDIINDTRLVRREWLERLEPKGGE